MTTLPELLPTLLRELRQVFRAGDAWFVASRLTALGLLFDVPNAVVFAIIQACHADPRAFAELDAARLDLEVRFAFQPDERAELAGRIIQLFEADTTAALDTAAALALGGAARAERLHTAHRLKSAVRTWADEPAFAFLPPVVDALDEAAGVPIGGRWVIAMLVIALASSADAWAEFCCFKGASDDSQA